MWSRHSILKSDVTKFDTNILEEKQAIATGDMTPVSKYYSKWKTNIPICNCQKHFVCERLNSKYCITAITFYEILLAKMCARTVGFNVFLILVQIINRVALLYALLYFICFALRALSLRVAVSFSFLLSSRPSLLSSLTLWISCLQLHHHLHHWLYCFYFLSNVDCKSSSKVHMFSPSSFLRRVSLPNNTAHVHRNDSYQTAC